MENFWQGFEKKATVAESLGKIPWVKKYREIAAKPSFKAKKAFGTIALVGGGLAYGAHKLTDEPDSMQEQQRAAQPSQY